MALFVLLNRGQDVVCVGLPQQKVWNSQSFNLFIPKILHISNPEKVWTAFLIA